ncbi:DM13 domain-containing protein [Trichostrongylus colubriformis]|uniref:DM13 domain-containing protein n=1 Tax=Trichostrongylus colubriformis TaxID=6319 RepID=A0AAN8J342_TRICO
MNLRNEEVRVTAPDEMSYVSLPFKVTEVEDSQALGLKTLQAAGCAGTESYFGVPVGTMKHTTLGIRAEVFLADDHTIVLDKFTHKPHQSGCTALMIGPSRREDLRRKIGDGILLPYTQPNFSWEDVRRFKRSTKRGTETFTPNIEVGSSEKVESVENEEQTEQPKRIVKQTLLPLLDGETHRRTTKSTTERSTASSTFPTLITEPFTTLTDRLSDDFTSPAGSTEASMIVSEASEQEWQTPNYKMGDDLGKDLIETASPTARWDPSFSLPPATDEQVAFLLTNGGRLSDYKWIGLYDHCDKKSIPLVWLSDVDPPREEEIGPMIALEHNISSGEVRILNCNTILVPSLFYEPDRGRPNTFFFVGVGNVTDNAQQTKARAIGYELDDPIEQHYGDDVMVRLPRGVRSFDVDFLTIYNEDVKKTYGYVILPSLLVPPCADDL